MTSKKQEMAATDNRELSSDAERTRPGAVFSPAVDIFETETEITVLADMPGVTADQLQIDLREGVLTLEGHVATAQSEGQQVVVTEYVESGTYFRRFTLSDTIDQERINATLTDGVLRLELPKVAKAQPRRIQVKTT